jgi:hypothetical protein
VRFALKQLQGFLGRIDERPIKREQLGARSPREYQPSHRLFRHSPFSQLVAQVIELNRLISCELIETGL